VKFAWIHQHRRAFPVKLMCRALGVSRGGCYASFRRPKSTRQARREEVVAKIRESHERSRGAYGSPRVFEDLKANQVKVSLNTVAKYMREEGVSAHRPKRFVPATTDAGHTHPVAPNLLDRDFTRGEPNTGYVSDITYVPTAEGWLFLAVVIDLFSRRVVGHATAENLKASLTLDALEMTLRGRTLPGAGAGAGERLHHSDRGVQYACVSYRAVLEAHGLTASMSRVGNCYDNAVAESFFATLKRELVSRVSYATRAEARRSIFEYIEVFYNRQRRHSSLGYLSPAQFEKQRAVA
jgi:transposase InsO family protein